MMELLEAKCTLLFFARLEKVQNIPNKKKIYFLKGKKEFVFFSLANQKKNQISITD